MLKKKRGGKRASDLTGKEMKNTSTSPKDRDERKEYPSKKKEGNREKVLPNTVVILVRYGGYVNL